MNDKCKQDDDYKDINSEVRVITQYGEARKNIFPDTLLLIKRLK